MDLDKTHIVVHHSVGVYQHRQIFYNWRVSVREVPSELRLELLADRDTELELDTVVWSLHEKHLCRQDKLGEVRWCSTLHPTSAFQHRLYFFWVSHSTFLMHHFLQQRRLFLCLSQTFCWLLSMR